MKKLLLNFGLCMLISAPAYALVEPKYTSKETELYAFSDEILQAVDDCSKYKAEFAIKDTPYARLGDFAGQAELKSEFEIYEKGENLCRMRVRISALGKGETRFNCRLNDEQRYSLLRAMRDKSTEEYIVTIPTQEEADCSGCSTSITFSGNMFDTMLALLKPKVCAELHFPPTKDEIKAAQAERNDFAIAFRSALHRCSPNTAVRDTLPVTDDIKIVGLAEDGKCQLQYMGFNLKADTADLLKVTGYKDLNRLLVTHLDSAKYQYEDKYESAGILFGIEACRQKNGFYDSGENIYKHGYVEAHAGLEAQRVKDVCRILVKNTISVSDIYYRDYSLQCDVRDIFWDQLTGLYQQLIEDYGAKSDTDKTGMTYYADTRYTEETLKADADIFKRIREAGYCVPKLPTDPAQPEIKELLYRDAPVVDNPENNPSANK